jgi:hypothetical protein
MWRAGLRNQGLPGSLGGLSGGNLAGIRTGQKGEGGSRVYPLVDSSVDPKDDGRGSDAGQEGCECMLRERTGTVEQRMRRRWTEGCRGE